MAYINGLRSFGHRSQLTAARSISKKRESTDKWINALARAEQAHWLCRKAAELAREERFKEAEETAIRGINELKERSVSNSVFFIGYLVTDEFHDSVSLAPDVMYSGISELWDEEIVDRV